MIRASLLIGLGFAVLMASIRGIFGIVAVLRGRIGMLDVLRECAMFFVAAFVLGVVFSGLLALSGRGRRFADLSLPRIAALGGGAGLLYFLFIGVMGAFTAWTPQLALLNFSVLVGFGAASATSIMLVARRSKAMLEAPDDPPPLEAGDR